MDRFFTDRSTSGQSRFPQGTPISSQQKLNLSYGLGA